MMVAGVATSVVTVGAFVTMRLAVAGPAGQVKLVPVQVAETGYVPGVGAVNDSWAWAEVDDVGVKATVVTGTVVPIAENVAVPIGAVPLVVVTPVTAAVAVTVMPYVAAAGVSVSTNGDVFVAVTV
jgi:hypothetical protein